MALSATKELVADITDLHTRYRSRFDALKVQNSFLITGEKAKAETLAQLEDQLQELTDKVKKAEKKKKGFFSSLFS